MEMNREERKEARWIKEGGLRPRRMYNLKELVFTERERDKKGILVC